MRGGAGSALLHNGIFEVQCCLYPANAFKPALPFPWAQHMQPYRAPS